MHRQIETCTKKTRRNGGERDTYGVGVGSGVGAARGRDGVGVEVPGVMRPGSRGCLVRFIFFS